jgi:hypothetical protein
LDEVTGSGEDYIMSSFMICTPIKYYSGGQIMKNEMGMAYSILGEQERYIQGIDEKT